MFRFFSIVLLLLGGLGIAALAQSDDTVSIESLAESPVSAGKITYAFNLKDNEAETYLGDNDLVVSHEKKLHLIIYDPGLMEFQHVHPEFINGSWNVDLDFKVNGEYWIWAQGILASGNVEFSAPTRLVVENGEAAWPSPPSLTDVRDGSDGVSTVELSKNKVWAEKMSVLRVFLGRNDGTDSVNTPYLGAFAHVIVVSELGDQILHVHPMDGGNSHEGMIHATFPKKGFYRLWVQFLDDGVLRTVPLSVQVFAN